MLGPRLRWSSGGQLLAALQAGSLLGPACWLPISLSCCRICVTSTGGCTSILPWLCGVASARSWRAMQHGASLHAGAKANRGTLAGVSSHRLGGVRPACLRAMGTAIVLLSPSVFVYGLARVFLRLT